MTSDKTQIDWRVRLCGRRPFKSHWCNWQHDSLQNCWLRFKSLVGCKQIKSYWCSWKHGSLPNWCRGSEPRIGLYKSSPLWCNGSTKDCGSFSSGSNLGSWTKHFGLTCSLEANFPSTEIVMGPIPIRSTKKPTLILTNDCISKNVRNEVTVTHSFERYLCNILG